MNAILMEAAAGGLGGWGIIALYAVFIAGMFWLMSRPQKKEQKRLQALMESLAVGDTIKTTSGFYGMVIDIPDDTVIVEFGNNKNCRIPMDKAAITDVEKPDEE